MPSLDFVAVKRPPDKLMEDPLGYRTTSSQARPVRPLDDPDFIGAEAALKRASAKAVARDRAAGLEPIVRTQPNLPTRNLLGEQK